MVIDEFEEDLGGQVFLWDEHTGELLLLQHEGVILGDVETVIDGHEVLKGCGHLLLSDLEEAHRLVLSHEYEPVVVYHVGI